MRIVPFLTLCLGIAPAVDAKRLPDDFRGETLADEQVDHRARAWKKRHQNRTLRAVLSSKVIECLEEEDRELDLTPDKKIGEISDPDIASIYDAVIDCELRIERDAREEEGRHKQQERKGRKPKRRYEDDAAAYARFA